MNGNLLSYCDSFVEGIPAPGPESPRCPYCRSYQVQKIKGSGKYLCPGCIVSFERKK